MKIMIKKTIGLVLACVIIAGCMLPAMAAARQYDDRFTDIDTSKWYYTYVVQAYELGLIDGFSDGTFKPDGTLTVAQAVKLAACIHMINSTGVASFTESQPWYQVYVDYCAENSIIRASDYEDMDVPATRAQFAEILAASLPAAALAEMNTVNDGDIPDVAMSRDSYGNSVYRLYRAGVLTGSDEIGTFNADSNIKRSEVSTIVVRMSDPGTRATLKLSKEPEPEPEPVPEPEPQYQYANVYVGTFGRTKDSFTENTMPYTGEVTPEMLIEGIAALTKEKIVLDDDVEVSVSGGYVYINVYFSEKSSIYSRLDSESLSDMKVRVYTVLDSIKKTMQAQYVSKANNIDGRVKVYFSTEDESEFVIDNLGLDMTGKDEWPNGVFVEETYQFDKNSTEYKEVSMIASAIYSEHRINVPYGEDEYTEYFTRVEDTTISNSAYAVYEVTTSSSSSSANGTYAVNLSDKSVYAYSTSSKKYTQIK